MKRTRLQQWSGRLLSSNARPCLRQQVHESPKISGSVRSQSTAPASNLIYQDRRGIKEAPQTRQAEYLRKADQYPSPLPEKAAQSAKLAALHARLALPSKLPVETLARALIDSSADASADFNNASLAQLGQSLLSYHVTEWLTTTYPRLPMTVLYTALSAYIGPATLFKIAAEWGVESAAYPGSEVDSGLLQFSKLQPGSEVNAGQSGRPDAKSFFRRGVSSRVVYDDEFGDLLLKKDARVLERSTEEAYSGFVRALVGSIYLHAGSAASKSFISSHVLSRHLPMERLFAIKQPTRELSRLCAREGFEQPVARMLSETGRLSRHPVFVVGIFSGDEKLGEGNGPSLDEARMRAAISALKAWYLYSPSSGRGGRVPSDVDNGGEWKAVHIDIGEIIN